MVYVAYLAHSVHEEARLANARRPSHQRHHIVPIAPPLQPRASFRPESGVARPDEERLPANDGKAHPLLYIIDSREQRSTPQNYAGRQLYSTTILQSSVKATACAPLPQTIAINLLPKSHTGRVQTSHSMSSSPSDKPAGGGLVVNLIPAMGQMSA